MTIKEFEELRYKYKEIENIEYLLNFIDENIEENSTDYSLQLVKVGCPYKNFCILDSTMQIIKDLLIKKQKELVNSFEEETQ